MKTRIIGRNEVEKLLAMPDVLAAVEKAFASEYEMPPKVYLPLEKYGGDFRAMPAWLDPYCGVKWVNVHPGNPKKFGLPTVMATYILNDPKNALPLAVMDATLITNFRTGAAGGVATKHLANPDAGTLGLIGAGAQARTQAMAIVLARKIRQVRVFDLNAAKCEAFKEQMRPLLGCEVSVAQSAKEACDADVISTCTPARGPVVFKEWIRPGTHINAIGADAPGKQELDPAILQSAKIVVDNWEQASHSGEINVPLGKGLISRENIAAEMKEVVRGKAVRKSKGDITLFDSTGLAVQDVATAALVYEQARRKKIGTEVDLV